ncbi:MAG: alpha/beta fold hydrolase [Thermoleophilaceae bacterium]
MPYVDVDGTRLYYEEAGAGEPVVFAHGNWTDHSSWALTVPELPASQRAIVYDRRGTGRSPRTREALTRRRHEDDLAALIEALGPAPAHVVGNSYGGSTALGLAARRPELVRSVVAHEPPLLAIVGDDPIARAAIAETEASLGAVLERVEACDAAGGAEQFVEEVALGPGGWATLPDFIREIMILNAATVAEELRDPAAVEVDLAALAELDLPVLLTKGDQSPAWCSAIVDRLDEAIEVARVVTVAGAGHNPHATHPAEYAAVVAEHARIGEVVR